MLHIETNDHEIKKKTKVASLVFAPFLCSRRCLCQCKQGIEITGNLKIVSGREERERERER